jgi:hypothetical protein
MNKQQLAKWPRIRAQRINAPPSFTGCCCFPHRWKMRLLLLDDEGREMAGLLSTGGYEQILRKIAKICW